MPRARVLNPGVARTDVAPVALSQEILGEARRIAAPEQCARLDQLAGGLQGAAPERIDGDGARIAFWINLYNALLLHCLCLKPVRGSMLRHPRLFAKIGYRVGRLDYTLNLIEHGLLRKNRRPPLHLRRTLRGSDPRLAAAPSYLDPRIHFALNCGARSCPPIQIYDPAALDAQLNDATGAYLELETTLEAERPRVILPRLMRLYAADFGSRDEQLSFVARYLPRVREWLAESAGRPRVGYGRFDWTVAPRPSP